MSTKAKPAYRSSASAVLKSAPPDYVSKQLAAARLGLSVRRVLELSTTGAIRRRQVMDPVTKRRQTVLSALDIEQVAVDAEKRPTAYRGGAAGEVAVLPPLQPQLQAAAPAPAHPDRPWLTVEEAEHYSGLPANFLMRMIADGRLPALDVGVRAGGRYRIARRDMDGIKAPQFPEIK